MNYDITFCSNKKCNNLECKRNQKNIPKLEYATRHIWQGEFKDCEYWNKKYIHSDSLYLEDPIEDKKKKIKEYQHKYYLEVTKKKRQEKRGIK